jgi:hypothetical protein
LSIQIAEQRPPRAQFVQYNGGNADEVAQLAPGMTPEVQPDGSLLLKAWWSSGIPVPVGAYVVQGPSGVQVYGQADFAAAYSVVA